MKAQTTRLPAKKVVYRDFENFNQKAFLQDVKLKNFSQKSDDSNENYEFLSYQFQSVVNKHAPIKTKIVRGNNAPFVNKTLRKEIYKRSGLRNKFLKNSSDSNWQKHRKQRNKCVKIRKKYIKDHFKSITRHGIMTNRKFWATIRPFLTNKEMITSNEISLKQGYDVINNEGKVAEFLSNAYINIVENTAGKKPLISVPDKDNATFSTTINTILEEYKYHPSVLNIKKHSEQAKYFSISEVTTTDALKLIKRVNLNKSMGEDQIPSKLIKTAGNFLVELLTDIINIGFSTSTFPDLPKRASVTPFDKGGIDKHIYTNCRPVIVFNAFSEIIESSIFDQLTKHTKEFLQTFVGGYRKLYSSQHILVCLIEQWKAQKQNSWSGVT